RLPRAAKGKGCPGYGSSGLSWRRGDRRTCCSLRIGEIQEQYYCLLLSRTAIYILLADLKKRLIKPIYTPTFYQHSINFAIGSCVNVFVVVVLQILSPSCDSPKLTG